MSEFQRYRNVKVKHRRIEIIEARPWTTGEALEGVIATPGAVTRFVVTALPGGASPTTGDMIARNPNHHAQQWLVGADDFASTWELVS